MAALDAPAPPEPTAAPRRPMARQAVMRRSRIVSALKLALPAAALGVVAVVLAWPDLAPEDRKLRLADAAQAPQVIDLLRMSNPRFVGEDEKGRPYVVTGTEAIQDSPKAPEVRMTAPKADLTQLNDAWVIVSGDRGVYHRLRHELALDSSVSLFQNDGTELHTEHADVELKAGNASGDVPVQGHGPAGSLKSQDGFELRERGRWILLKGKSSVILRETTPPKPDAPTAPVSAAPTPSTSPETKPGKAAAKPAGSKPSPGKPNDVKPNAVKAAPAKPVPAKAEPAKPSLTPAAQDAAAKLAPAKRDNKPAASTGESAR